MSSVRAPFPAPEQDGFTLVELLVSLIISIMLAAALAALLVGSTSAYSVQTSRARVYENARFAMEFLARDIRMAGYFGCVRDPAAIGNNLRDFADRLYDHRWPIEGYEGDGAWDSWFPSGHPVAELAMASGSDAITVRFANPARVARVEEMAAANEFRTGIDGHRFEPGNLVIVSDCDKADIFQVTGTLQSGRGVRHGASAHPTPGNLHDQLGGALGSRYDSTAWLMGYHGARYFVARRDPDNPSPDAPVALHRQYLGESGGIIREDLIEGIENMQILYGEDADGDGAVDGYRRAHQVADWNRVASVRLALLVRSSEEYGSGVDAGHARHELLGETITDGHGLRVRRHRFSTTIALRNRP